MLGYFNVERAFEQYRKHKLFWRILSHGGFLRDIIEGKTMEKATHRRKKIGLLNDVVKHRTLCTVERCSIRSIRKE